MHEKIKLKKDQGFTLIELMIVIAVIGILAVVLVPKVGAIKTQARMAGVDTNIRAVQAYVESRISSWNAAGTSAADIATDINNAFSGTAKLDNPLKSSDDALSAVATAPTDTTGIDPGEVVVITADDADPIKITVYDSNTTVMKDKTVEIEP